MHTTPRIPAPLPSLINLFFDKILNLEPLIFGGDFVVAQAVIRWEMLKDWFQWCHFFFYSERYGQLWRKGSDSACPYIFGIGKQQIISNQKPINVWVLFIRKFICAWKCCCMLLLPTFFCHPHNHRRKWMAQCSKFCQKRNLLGRGGGLGRGAGILGFVCVS